MRFVTKVSDRPTYLRSVKEKRQTFLPEGTRLPPHRVPYLFTRTIMCLTRQARRRRPCLSPRSPRRSTLAKAKVNLSLSKDIPSRRPRYTSTKGSGNSPSERALAPSSSCYSITSAAARPRSVKTRARPSITPSIAPADSSPSTSSVGRSPTDRPWMSLTSRRCSPAYIPSSHAISSVASPSKSGS